MRTPVTAAESSRSNGRAKDPYNVTYWTGIWEPTREAISKEVAWLRGELAPASPVISFTPQSSAVLFRERVLRINARRWLPLRGAALALERLGDISHVFGGIGAVAPYLQLLGRRPILFTVVIAGQPLPLASYDRVAHFVAESRGLRDALVEAGVPADRVDVIYPAVDLAHYTPHPSPDARRFRLLFASTPSDPDEIDSRGIGVLIELARARPDIDIVMPWRQWGRVDAALRVIKSREPSTNLRIEPRDVSDMAAVYRDVHATVCCFENGLGKAAPNFVVEGLASGRPALLCDSCGIADLVAEWGGGVVVPRTVSALAVGVDQLRSRYADACAQARRLAEHEFNQTSALERYRRLYQGLCTAH